MIVAWLIMKLLDTFASIRIFGPETFKNMYSVVLIIFMGLPTSKNKKVAIVVRNFGKPRRFRCTFNKADIRPDIRPAGYPL